MVNMGEFNVWTTPDGRQPLVYTGDPPTQWPILTMVNYMKWYTFYLVNPNGTIRAVDYQEWEPVENSTWAPPPTCDIDQYEDLSYPDGQFHTWSDHVPNPAQLERIAAQLGAQWDDCSREMIIGRYQREVLT